MWPRRLPHLAILTCAAVELSARSLVWASTTLLRAEVGVGGIARPGSTRVRAEIRNDEARPASALLVIECQGEQSARRSRSPLALVEHRIELPQRGIAKVEFAVPLPEKTKRVTARLRSLERGARDGKAIDLRATFVDATTRTVVFIGRDRLGLCGDDGIIKLSLGGPSEHSETASDWMRAGFVDGWNELPRTAGGYGGLDTVIATTPPSDNFTPEQASACERWLQRGGQLLVAANPAETTAPFLTRFLPVTLAGRTTFVDSRSLDQLIPGPPLPTLRIAIALATLRPGAELLLGSRKEPLAASGRVGLGGQVVWTAFDATREPLRGRTGRGELWKLLLRSHSHEGMSLSGLDSDDLKQRVRQVSHVRMPSRLATLSPLVAFALALLILTVHVSRNVERKEWTWVALVCGSIAFAGGYYLVAQRVVRAESVCAGVTTRYLLPHSDDELQIARAGLFLAEPRGVEFEVRAPDAHLTYENEHGSSPPKNAVLRDEGDSRRWRFTEEWPQTVGANRRAPRRGAIEARMVQGEAATDYHLVNRTTMILRQPRLVLFVDDKQRLVASLPTLPPGGSADATLAPGSSEVWTWSAERWSGSAGPKSMRMKSSRAGDRWELDRWLTETLLNNNDALGQLAARGYPAALVALTDAPPFPVAVRGVSSRPFGRQDWQHVVIAFLRGPHVRASPRYYGYTDLRYNGRLLAADVMPRESENDDATLLGPGETQFEFHFGEELDKGKQIYLSPTAYERNGARAEWALFNWRKGQWSPAGKFNEYTPQSSDHVHPTLGIVRARIHVKKGSRAKPQLAIHSFSLGVNR